MEIIRTTGQPPYWPLPRSSTVDLPGVFDKNVEILGHAHVRYNVDNMTRLWGTHCRVWRPIMADSVYGSEDEEYHYRVDHDFEGQMLIIGPTRVPRFGSMDQWTHRETTLFWNMPQEYDIPEQARIDSYYHDNVFSYRSEAKRRVVSNTIEILQVHQLVPFN